MDVPVALDFWLEFEYGKTKMQVGGFNEETKAQSVVPGFTYPEEVEIREVVKPVHSVDGLGKWR